MNLISNLPVDSSMILLFAIACVFIAAGIFLSFKPVFPGAAAAFLGLLLGSFSGFVPVASNGLWIWGATAAVAMMLYYIVPSSISRSGKGQSWMSLGALAGCMVGAAMNSMIAIVISTIVGIAFGALVYSRTRKGAEISSEPRLFLNYVLAKGLPMAVSYSITGIFAALFAAACNAGL